MKLIYLSLFLTFLVCLRIPAQEMPGDYRVPVLRLVPDERRVHVQSYSQRASETTVDFAGTALMPKAHGTAKVAPTRGGLKVEVHLEDLGPAPQVDPAYLTYVLFVRKGDESTLTGFTNLPVGHTNKPKQTAKPGRVSGLIPPTIPTSSGPI